MNANQRLNPTPPGYNPLPSPCCSEEFSSEPCLWNVPEPPHQTSPLHMRRHTHKHCLVHAHTHTQARVRTLTHANRHTHTQCLPIKEHTSQYLSQSGVFLQVTLVPKSLSKHTFTDTTIILTRPHIFSPCWRGMKDQLCRFVECWWAFTPPKGCILYF